MAGRRRSITVPIALASIAVGLSITLLVGWTLIIAQKLEESQAAVASNVSLLVLGILSFIFIMTVLVIFSIFLVREIREVRRQDSFIDSVTHELKSPLASIQLGVETLGRPELADGQRIKLREMIRSDIDRLSAFIDDVLHKNVASTPAKLFASMRTIGQRLCFWLEKTGHTLNTYKEEHLVRLQGHSHEA